MATARRMPRLAGVEHHTLDAGGLRMHVAELGSGPPVLLVHGWPEHWYSWRRVMPRLAEHHRVLAADLRGFGWSDAPPAGYDKRQLGRDLLAALDALGVDRCSIVGHDWGGMVAFLLALDHPERVERLVAMGCGHPWIEPDLSAAASAALRIAPYQSLTSLPLLGSRFVRHVLLPLADRTARARGSWEPAAARSFRVQFEEPERIAATVQLYRTWLTRELPTLRRLGSMHLQVDALYLHGSDDPVLRPHLVERGLDRQPRLAYELVEGAGHFLHEDEPALVAGRILAFLGAADV